MPDDAVVAGEDRDQRPVDRRRRAALPGGQPLGDFLEPAERAGGLVSVASRARVASARGFVRAGHGRDQGAEIVERQAGLAGAHQGLRALTFPWPGGGQVL